MVATFTDQAGFFEDNGYGLNIGLGMEFQFLKKIHFGLEYAFKFITLEQEAIPLQLNVGNTKKNTNFRPYGDWMNINLLLGVNFLEIIFYFMLVFFSEALINVLML